MPNWITNKITTAKHVIEAVVNEKGHVDFNLMAPFPGLCGADWSAIYGDAETAVQTVLGLAMNEHPLIASLEAQNRRNSDIKRLSDESFQQFIGMLENHRACGYLHSMDWQRDKWGTKWNACEPRHDFEAGTMQFDTAWACPKPVLVELSKRFPDEEITITYADEDIGCNCGTFTLKAGEVVSENIVPSWSSMSDVERIKWRLFAYQVKGYSADDIAEREAERNE